MEKLFSRRYVCTIRITNNETELLRRRWWKHHICRMLRFFCDMVMIVMLCLQNWTFKIQISHINSELTKLSIVKLENCILWNCFGNFALYSNLHFELGYQLYFTRVTRDMGTDKLVALNCLICAQEYLDKNPRRTGEINCENSTHMKYQMNTWFCSGERHNALTACAPQ